MIVKICENVYKLSVDSNVYLLENEKIVVDTGPRSQRSELLRFLDKVVPLDEVKKVYFTHLHYDHIGNFDLFANAEFFAGAAEIEDFNRDKKAAILDDDMVQKFNVELKAAVSDELFQIIETPGHTRGSICLFYPKQFVLFTGDTLFNKKMLGRTDLPTSVPSKIKKSLVKLLGYNFKILAPGHDY
ncbi:MAG: MBL fold metallo-hydrolase [Candidatus Woesearchaeota archaeon]|nr:MBL fold metallo-hydrolase [Candidatus Woesearchaeota archaeon]